MPNCLHHAARAGEWVESEFHANNEMIGVQVRLMNRKAISGRKVIRAPKIRLVEMTFDRIAPERAMSMGMRHVHTHREEKENTNDSKWTLAKLEKIVISDQQKCCSKRETGQTKFFLCFHIICFIYCKRRGEDEDDASLCNRCCNPLDKRSQDTRSSSRTVTI